MSLQDSMRSSPGKLRMFTYQWFPGGDGLVFSVASRVRHENSTGVLPHKRAQCPGVQESPTGDE